MLTSTGEQLKEKNAISEIGYVDRDTWLPVAVYGQKLNSDGNLLFQPLTNGVDVIDGTTGLLLNRVALPVQIANVYDALVVGNVSGVIYAITPEGIAEVNVSALTSAQSSRHLLKDSRGRDRSKLAAREHQNGIVRRNWLPRPELRYKNRSGASEQ